MSLQNENILFYSIHKYVLTHDYHLWRQAGFAVGYRSLIYEQHWPEQELFICKICGIIFFSSNYFVVKICFITNMALYN